MKAIFIFISVFFYLSLSAQILDDFSDGDFSNSPAWNGNTGSFKVSSGRLQLDTSGSGIKYLSTASVMFPENQWEFWLRMNFDPSASNYVKIYLSSDQSNLSLPLNGYYLKIGENLANDAIELYKQTGTSNLLLAKGKPGHGAVKPALRIRVIYDSSGKWTILSDTLGYKQFVTEATAIDKTTFLSSFFGFVCTFTSTNSKNFYFDDIYSGKIKKDTLGPKVISCKAINSNELILTFDEELDTSKLDTTMFIWMTPMIQPNKIKILSQKEIQLTFTDYFEDNASQLLGLKVYDKNSNINIDVITFIYYHILPEGIIINELFPDPSPAVDLPESEFIELYNTLSISVPLLNWKLSDPSTTVLFKDIYIPAKSYLIICNTADTAKFFKFGKVYGCSMPSLNNSFDIITLKNDKDETIDSVAYSDLWYQDLQKKNGGWTLELIKPVYNCRYDPDSWISSIDISGGTPGKVNSVVDSSLDYSFPLKINSLIISDSNSISLSFNKKLGDTQYFTNYKFASISDSKDIYSLTNIHFQSPDNNPIELIFNKNIKQNAVYRLWNLLIYNCNIKLGINKFDTTFTIPGKTDSFDVVINEVLFNPKTNSYDFVELYNRSKKYIDLSSLKIANLNDSLQINQAYSVSDKQTILLPEDYVVLTQNKQDIQNQYLVKYPDKMIELKQMPSMNDDEGRIVLLDNKNRIDYFHYLEDYHFPLLDDKEGVSLERINFDKPTNQPDNWTSASSTVGYATPAYKNSQFSEISPAEMEIQLDPETFSPDGDGFHDQLLIKYQLNKNGYFCSINIYNVSGQLVKKLVLNDLLGIEGFYSWNGLTDNSELASIGVYIVLVELMNVDGTSKKHKKVCTLAP